MLHKTTISAVSAGTLGWLVVFPGSLSGCGGGDNSIAGLPGLQPELIGLGVLPEDSVVPHGSTIQFSAIHQHLAKSRVIIHGRHKTTAAGKMFGRFEISTFAVRLYEFQTMTFTGVRHVKRTHRGTNQRFIKS